MRFIRLAVIAIAALASVAAAPRGDWTTTINPGPGGSHVLGNPNAKVKLTEFISYTCPHCAHFHQESETPLLVGYVLPGKVSVEVRHFLRDPIDLAAALTTNCGDPKKFFRNHHAILQNQDKWMAVMGTASKVQQSRWTNGPFGARMRAIAADFGFYRLMEQRGYDRVALDRCLADEAMARKLTAQTREAANAGVEGTPSFMLDGNLLAGTYDWKSLSTQLDARL
jgi:protein-disulfide isomerase